MKGKDKCMMHGGKTPIKSGLYSKYAPKRLADKIEEARNDPDLLDVRGVISFQVSLLNDFIEKYKGGDLPFNAEAISLLLTISDKLSQNIERLNKIENGETYNVKIEAVQKTIIQVVEIIKHIIPDPKTREKIAEALGKVAV